MKTGAMYFRARYIALVAVLFAATLALAGTQAVVVRPVTNMYRSGSLDAEVVSQAIFGTTVTVVEQKGSWAQIQTPVDNYTGWVAMSDLKPVQKAYASDGKVAQVIGYSAHVFRDKSVTKHAPIVTLPFESRVEVISEGVQAGERWLEVRLPDGATGWIQAGDVALERKNLSIPETIELAKKFIGVTYTWGGTSSFGYDCSGFMQMLQRQRGVLMPRDAYQQAAWSGVAPVERGQLQPGDLLYFGSNPEKITHTGMYIGEGKFIHDTTSGHPSVQISVLDEQPWTKLLVAARRVK